VGTKKKDMAERALQTVHRVKNDSTFFPEKQNYTKELKWARRK
jgi:hypothetical protein